MNAFNYHTQEWNSGEEARCLRIQQLRETYTLLSGPRGEEFARFLGIKDKADDMRKILAELEILGNLCL